MRRLKILFASQFPPPMGGQNAIRLKIFRALSQEPDFELHHLDMRFVSSFSEARKPSFRKAFELIRVVFRAIRLRLKTRFDVLMFPAGGPQTVPVIRDIVLLPLLSCFADKVVVNFHAAGIADRMEAHRGVLGWMLLFAYRCVDVAVVMTPYNRRDPQSLGIRSIATIPHQLPDRAPQFAGRNKTPEAVKKFVYLGHLYDQKGTPQLLEAFAAICRTHPDVRLELMGEFVSPYSETIYTESLTHLGISQNVMWHGVVDGDRKYEILTGCDCFVFPSIAPYESFGLVLIEAMMCRLPILVSDWRGNTDVIGPDFGGIVFPVLPTLEKGIAGALRSALAQQDRWSEWGQVNRVIYETRFRAAGECEDYTLWLKQRFIPQGDVRRPDR